MEVKNNKESSRKVFKTNKIAIFSCAIALLFVGVIVASYTFFDKKSPQKNIDTTISEQPEDTIEKPQEMIEKASSEQNSASDFMQKAAANTEFTVQNEQKSSQKLVETLPKKNTSPPTAQVVDAVVPKVKPTTDYTNLYPELYAIRPEKQISPDKTIFLTFDDGPSARTAEILDILKQNDIKATFFVIGKEGPEAAALMRRIVEEGHTIAPHSYTHNFRQIYSSVESFLDDFNKIYKLVHKNTGIKATIFRFAGGSKNAFNKNTYRDIIAEMTRRGFDYYDWNLSTGDAVRKTPTPAVECIGNVTKNSAKCNNAVILMHDSAPKKTTVEALPGLIQELKEQGFSFEKLSNEISPIKYSLVKPYA